MTISNLLKMFKVQQHLNSNFIISLHFHFNVQHLNLNSQVNSLNLFILLCLVILKKKTVSRKIFLLQQIFIWQNATTCLSLRQEHSLAYGVSMLQPQPSAMCFHHPLIIR